MSKQYKIIITLASTITVSLLIVFIKSSPHYYGDNDILARMDAGIVSREDFVERYKKYLDRTGMVDNMPARKAILRQMLDELLLLDTITPEITESYQYKYKIISKRDDFLVSGFANKIIKPSISVSEEDLRHRFAVESASYHIRQLFTSTYEEAMTAKNALDKGVNFELIASNLKVPSILASNTDDLGYVKGKELKPNALMMLAPLAVNKSTPPIKVPTGYTLLQLLDKKPNPLITEQNYAGEIGRLTSSIRSENLALNAKTYIDSYLKSLDLKWDTALLTQLHKYLNEQLNSSTELTVREDLSDYGFSSIDNIFLNENVTFSINDYFDWSNRFSYRKPAYLKTIKELQAYIKGLVSRRYLVEQSLRNGLDDEEFDANYSKAEKMIMLKMLKQGVIDTSYISEKEIREFYEENYSDYSVPAQVRVREIVVQSRDFALTLVDSIRAGASASELATKYTLRQAVRKYGGDLGYLSVSEFGELRKEVEFSGIGRVTGPFQKGDYNVIFEILDRIPSYIPTFKEMESELRKQYITDNRNLILDRTYNRLAKERHSRIYSKKLSYINLVSMNEKTAI